MAEIEFQDVTKRYGDGYEAVRHLNLERAGRGADDPCRSLGLRQVDGAAHGGRPEDISDGELKIDGTVVNEKAPKDRDIAMVFQNYALYPHMTVRENMGFALKLAKTPQQEIDQKVNEAARILDLEQHLDRKPANLSGGQRQRVAMGRAIVRNPSVFLMDEPLSNLDAKLRVQMRTEIARIQQQLEVTTIYVTHDQTEAMTLGDRIAVMRAGMLQQVGPPAELYGRPANLFVAGFIGSPSMNFLPGELDGDTLKLPIGSIEIADSVRQRLDAGKGGGRTGVIVGLRPEDFEDASLVSAASPRPHVHDEDRRARVDGVGVLRLLRRRVRARLLERARGAGSGRGRGRPPALTRGQPGRGAALRRQPREGGRGGQALVRYGAPAPLRRRDRKGAARARRREHERQPGRHDASGHSGRGGGAIRGVRRALQR